MTELKSNVNDVFDTSLIKEFDLELVEGNEELVIEEDGLNIATNKTKILECPNIIKREDVQKRVSNYIRYHRKWVIDFENFWKCRFRLTPIKRLENLLKIVTINGWNMNRHNQCTFIKRKIQTNTITNDEIKEFWKILDDLNGINIRDLSESSKYYENNKNKLVANIKDIIKILKNWNQRVDTITFVTKPILMFNWGQSPAFDKKVREQLKMRRYRYNAEEIFECLSNLGTWINNSEKENQFNLDETVSEVLSKNKFSTVPTGRALDMILFTG